jgi:hypothetical protein
LGLNFGGLKFDSGISLGVRYHLGLGDLYDEGKAQNSTIFSRIRFIILICFRNRMPKKISGHFLCVIESKK